MDAALKADIAKIYADWNALTHEDLADLARIDADWMALTHEDLEEMYAVEGYGCKNCDEPKSASWWRCSWDIYCAGCKRAMSRELRGLKWVRVLTRAEVAKAIAA